MKRWLCTKTLCMENDAEDIRFIKGKLYKQVTDPQDRLRLIDETEAEHWCYDGWEKHFRAPLKDILKKL